MFEYGWREVSVVRLDWMEVDCLVRAVGSVG